MKFSVRKISEIFREKISEIFGERISEIFGEKCPENAPKNVKSVEEHPK